MNRWGLMSALALAAALLLAGCGEKTQKSAEDLQARYAQMQGYEAIVETAVPREDRFTYAAFLVCNCNCSSQNMYCLLSSFCFPFAVFPFYRK